MRDWQDVLLKNQLGINWRVSIFFRTFVDVINTTIKMKIEHIAIWAEDIELLREFYMKYFGMRSNDMYVNPRRQFSSYFLSFENEATRIELMNIPCMESPASRGNLNGLAHVAISVGGKDAVDALTERLRADGYQILGEPRTSGDGYYESAVADPEGNYVEIVG